MNGLQHSIIESIEEIKSLYPHDEKVVRLYENGIKNTLLTTIQPQENGDTFVITGDIPAMWLRDSSAQVRPLLLFAKKDKEIFNLIRGVISIQMKQIQMDPYANAFNNGKTNTGHQDDKTDMKPEVWERKYEVDSLCYPIQLAYLFWKSTGCTEHFDEDFVKVCRTIIETFRVEQYHGEHSPYTFQRLEIDDHCSWEYETLRHDGKGTPVSYTGMTWSGFRPSDDACKYGYLIPSNMFAVVILKYMEEIARDILEYAALALEAKKLWEEIHAGIQKYGVVNHPGFGPVYAYEVDGSGHYHFMDDANVPSLMGIPYMGYAPAEDPVYINTRKMLLSKENPFYYEGKVAKGIGSPHTPYGYIWHIALAIQGMTSVDSREKMEILELLKCTDADTDLMHESFHVDNPCEYTRPWFSWANAMFAEFLLSMNDIAVPGTPLAQIINK